MVPQGSLNTWNWHKVLPSWKMSQKYEQGERQSVRTRIPELDRPGVISAPPLTGDLARVADPFCLSVLICGLGMTACFTQ